MNKNEIGIQVMSPVIHENTSSMRVYLKSQDLININLNNGIEQLLLSKIKAVHEKVCTKDGFVIQINDDVKCSVGFQTGVQNP